MNMYHELEEEFSTFVNDMNNNQSFCKYLDEDWYEDDYSHNEISECQMEFIRKAKEWLHENKSWKYMIKSTYCVFVVSEEEAINRGFIYDESDIIQ